MILSPLIRQRFFDSNGLPLAGGLLNSYVAGTTTPQATYTDAGGLTPNANPVVLDASGYANVWLDPTLAYKFVLTDASSVVQWTVDNVAGEGTGGLPYWSTSFSYAAGDIVADTSGAGLLYVSLQNNNAGNALTNVSFWRMFEGKIRTLAADTTLLVTDEIVLSDSSAASRTMTLPLCSTTPIGKKITIKDVGTGGNTTTVKGNTADLVDGNNTFSFPLSKNVVLAVINNGSSWNVVTQTSIINQMIGAGSVTQDKLAARATGASVALGGVAVSASCGTFSTASVTFVGVTNLSVTIVTGGRPVRITLEGDGGGTGSPSFMYGNSSSTGAGNNAFVYLSGTTSGANPYTFNGNIAAATGPSSPTFIWTDFPAAGTQTYTVQLQNQAGITTFMRNYRVIAYEM